MANKLPRGRGTGRPRRAKNAGRKKQAAAAARKKATAAARRKPMKLAALAVVKAGAFKDAGGGGGDDDGSLGLDEFLGQVADAMIPAQQRLDLQSEAYLAGSSSPRPLPAMFRLPRLTGQM